MLEIEIFFITIEAEVMESRLRAQVESPTKAASSREAKLEWLLEMTILSLGNRRIPARSCKVPLDTSSSTRSASCGGGGGGGGGDDDEVSTELMRSLVEERTRGFLLSTIATKSFLYHTQNPSFALLKPTPLHKINALCVSLCMRVFV